MENKDKIKAHLIPRQILSILLLIVILLLPAIDKISHPIPADWFISKFTDSILGIIPGGILISYSIIILLEFLGPILFIIGLFKITQKKESKIYFQYGFTNCYILFLVLTFGSFLINDYSNGFKDFMYFIGVMLIERFYFNSKKANSL